MSKLKTAFAAAVAGAGKEIARPHNLAVDALAVGFGTTLCIAFAGAATPVMAIVAGVIGAAGACVAFDGFKGAYKALRHDEYQP